MSKKDTEKNEKKSKGYVKPKFTFDIDTIDEIFRATRPIIQAEVGPSQPGTFILVDDIMRTYINLPKVLKIIFYLARGDKIGKEGQFDPDPTSAINAYPGGLSVLMDALREAYLEAVNPNYIQEWKELSKTTSEISKKELERQKLNLDLEEMRIGILKKMKGEEPFGDTAKQPPSLASPDAKSED